MEDVEVVSYKSERELLEGFQEHLEKLDVDIMTGWNIFGFDLEYLYKRAVITEVSSKFFELSKMKDH